MSSKLYDFVGVFSRGLTTLDHVLEVGAKHAQATGASEAEMLGWRLAPDMFTLRQQAANVINSSLQWGARGADVAQPAGIEGEPGLAELKAAIARSKAWLDGLRPEQFAGRDAIPLKVNLGQIEPTLPLARWFDVFAVPNFYFHLTTAYAILRHKGAPLGKVDFFAGGM